MKGFGIFLLAMVAAFGAYVGFARSGLSLGQPPASAALPDRRFGEPKTGIKLSDLAIDESSGVARSAAFPGKYYTHNDSGDSARFWRFGLDGRCEGPFEVVGAQAVDWEDSAGAAIGNAKYLYFADIGDNQERRASVVVYRLPEPGAQPGSVGKFDRFELTYPDGPHNAETFLVHPKRGEMQIVTKADSGECRVYGTGPMPAPGKMRLTFLGSFTMASPLPPGRQSTGGDVSPDGRFVVVRSYLEAYEFPCVDPQNWFKAKPVKVKTALEPQGEAIGYSLDGKMLVTTSEHAPCQVATISIAEK